MKKMRVFADQVYLRMAGKMKSVVTAKKEGVSALVISILLVVIGVALVAAYRSGVSEVLKDVFKKITEQITTLIAEP